MTARVLRDNERSLRAFAAAGFLERSRDEREVLLERREHPDGVEAAKTREQARLEELWAGDFGDAYVERNVDAERGRNTSGATCLAADPRKRSGDRLQCGETCAG